MESPASTSSTGSDGPLEGSTVSPSSSPTESPTLGTAQDVSNIGTPPRPDLRPPPHFAIPPPRVAMPAIPPPPPPGYRPPVVRYQPPYAKYAQINTPYDFLVPYEYFSTPQGFKPYHFRQCYLPTSSTYVIVEKGWSTQVDLDSWSSLLLRYHSQCHTDIRHMCTTDGFETLRKPKIQVCPLYSTEMQRAIDRAIPPELEDEDPKLCARLRHLSHIEDQVVFFIVVQGGDDGAIAKLVVKATFYQIMTEIFYTASNSLNVVFSGILREKDLARLGRGSRNSFFKALGIKGKAKCVWKQVKSNIRFKRVDSYDDLLEDDADKNVVRVGC